MNGYSALQTPELLIDHFRVLRERTLTGGASVSIKREAVSVRWWQAEQATGLPMPSISGPLLTWTEATGAWTRPANCKFEQKHCNIKKKSESHGKTLWTPTASRAAPARELTSPTTMAGLPEIIAERWQHNSGEREGYQQSYVPSSVTREQPGSLKYYERPGPLPCLFPFGWLKLLKGTTRTQWIDARRCGDASWMQDLSPTLVYPFHVLANKYTDRTNPYQGSINTFMLVLSHLLGVHMETWEISAADVFEISTNNSQVKISEIISIKSPNHSQSAVVYMEEIAKQPLIVLPMSGSVWFGLGFRTGSNPFEPKIIPTHQEPILWPVKPLDTLQYCILSEMTAVFMFLVESKSPMLASGSNMFAQVWQKSEFAEPQTERVRIQHGGAICLVVAVLGLNLSSQIVWTQEYSNAVQQFLVWLSDGTRPARNLIGISHSVGAVALFIAAEAVPKICFSAMITFEPGMTSRDNPHAPFKPGST
ncbi:hypothetical protein C8R43DRAFT_964929 [Mycena crocata]|nr:hypothetical protein C8R43DRAFT_964929 [Mycena crocata]